MGFLSSLLVFGEFVAFVFFLKFSALVCLSGISDRPIVGMSITTKFQEKVIKYSNKNMEVQMQINLLNKLMKHATT